ncbi:hypothetical protein EJB05_57714, partial [Eragrostis curvula]
MGKPWALRRLLPCVFLPSGRKHKEENELLEPEEGHRHADDDVSVSLPDDIIFDVLSRLPVKSLHRFRCVCRAWRALISDADDPAFAAAFRNSRAAAAAPVVVAMFDKAWHLHCPGSTVQPPRDLELRVIDTADGSVLRVVKGVRSTYLAATPLDLAFVDHGMYGSSVIDPATGRVVATVAGLRADDYGDPGIDEFCRSFFGRAAPSGAYKVARLRGKELSTPETGWWRFEVATLRDNERDAISTWRQRPAPPVSVCWWLYSCTATVNGVVHFMHGDAPTGGASLPEHSDWNRVARFDLESEEWKATIDGPPMTGWCLVGQDETWDVALRELKGTLGVVETAGSCNHLRYANVWRLVDSAHQRSVWVKECTIEMGQQCCRFFKALEIFQDGRMLMVRAFGKDPCDLHEVYAMHVNSLRLPHHGDGHDGMGAVV